MECLHRLELLEVSTDRAGVVGTDLSWNSGVSCRNSRPGCESRMPAIMDFRSAYAGTWQRAMRVDTKSTDIAAFERSSLCV